MGRLFFLMSGRTFHKSFWIKKYTVCPPHCRKCLALGLYLHRHGWSTFAVETSPSQPPSLLGGPLRKGILVQGMRSFWVGFWGARMGKAGGGRRWGISEASDTAAGTCFFPNWLNRSPSHFLSAVLGRLKPLDNWRAPGAGAMPTFLLRPSSPSVKRDCLLLGQVESWALPLDRHWLLGTAERFQMRMSLSAWPHGAGSWG